MAYGYDKARKIHPKAGIISDADKAIVLKRQDYRCFYCNHKLILQPVFDHLVPRSKGGPHGICNRVAACTICDKVKASRMPTDAEMLKFYAQYVAYTFLK
jgi:5-methylcytosine-specific restriction endonuclease McrA